jgi:PBP1b-binding outer membrane lipoprotein LpoB
MKKLKKIIPLLCILILAVIFSACAKEDATVEESHWELYAVTSFKNNDVKINADEIYLTLKDGELIIEDVKNRMYESCGVSENLIKEN